MLKTPELQAIEKSKAEQIKATFEPMVEMLEAFEEKFLSIVEKSKKGIDIEITTAAKRLRIDVGRVRIETEKLRKAQKEEYLRAGKAIDGVANILKWAVTDKENKLKEIENHFEIQEQKRLEKLQSDRVEILSKYVEDASERNLSQMDEDVWDAYFHTKKREYEDRIAAEKKAEADRIAKEKAEAAERERIRKENERLRKEAAAKEKQLAAERAKAAQERKIAEDKARKEREKVEQKLKVEQETARKAAEKAAAERVKLVSEIKAKEAAERTRVAKIEALKQADMQKGDAAKMKDFVSDLTNLKLKYEFKSVKMQNKYADAGLLIDKIINYIKK